MIERLNHNLLPNVGKLTMPIIIIVGDQDTSCPPAHQQILFDAIPSINKELVIIKHAPHTFRDIKHLKELKTILSTWLQQLK